MRLRAKFVLWMLYLSLVAGLMGMAHVAKAQTGIAAGPPETVKQNTSDGVGLSFTYYPSAEGKNATPVVLLHDYKDTQGMLAAFASRLQSPPAGEAQPSFAVVTIDLRGHGGSSKQYGDDEASWELDPSRLGIDDIERMSTQDLEAVRKYLVGQNDAGKLNLNKLCLVGLGMGATVAVNWAAQDWTAPPLLVGKQGQDVKALVLVSPRWKYKGVAMQPALRVAPLKQQVAWMLIAGKDDSAGLADAKRIFKQLERAHPAPQSTQAGPRDLELVELPLALQGGRLFSQAGPQIEDQIIHFLGIHVANRDLPWSKRRNRLE